MDPKQQQRLFNSNSNNKTTIADQTRATSPNSMAVDETTSTSAADNRQLASRSQSEPTSNANGNIPMIHMNSNGSGGSSDASTTAATNNNVDDDQNNGRPNYSHNGGGYSVKNRQQTYSNRGRYCNNYFNNHNQNNQNGHNNNHNHHHYHHHPNNHQNNHHYTTNNNYSHNNNRMAHHHNHHHSHPFAPLRQHNHNPRTNNNNPPQSLNYYELDGQYKFNVKRDGGGSYNVVQCPNCVLKNLAQIYQFKGRPWCKKDINYRKDYKDIYHAISAELEHFYHFMKPTMQDYTLRKATFFSIASTINKIAKVDKVKYYGSYSSNTYLPVSDIDLVVYCYKNVSTTQILSEITDQLFADGIIESHCQMIHHSRIPLLKFYDSLTGFPINITINTPNVMERANYIRENIKPDSYLIKILYFLKYYLLHKGTNQVFHGGIGSYALSLMVISFFQDPVIKNVVKGNEKSENNSLLGRLLISFLERYSNMDFIRDNTISVIHPGGYHPGALSPTPNFPNKKNSILKIADPLEPSQIVTTGSFNSDIILKDFGHLLEMLISEPTDSSIKDDFSILGQAIAVVDNFVEYRYILSDLYRYWFSFLYYNRSKPILGYQAFGEFIQRRNSFGKRDQDFNLKRFDDGSIQVSLDNSINNGGRHYYPKHHPQRRPQDKRYSNSAFDNENQIDQSSRAYALYSNIEALDTSLGSTFYNITPATSESSLNSGNQNGDNSDDNTTPDHCKDNNKNSTTKHPYPSKKGKQRNKRQNENNENNNNNAGNFPNLESDSTMCKNNQSNNDSNNGGTHRNKAKKLQNNQNNLGVENNQNKNNIWETTPPLRPVIGGDSGQTSNRNQTNANRINDTNCSSTNCSSTNSAVGTNPTAPPSPPQPSSTPENPISKSHQLMELLNIKPPK